MSDQSPTPGGYGQPPVPRYGEYAPPPQGAPLPAPQGTPVPVPRYGEYAPTTTRAADPVPVYGAPAGRIGAAPQRRTWDVVLSVALLLTGVFGVLLGFLYAWALGQPDLISQSLEQAGYGTWDGDAGAAPGIIAISHPVLWLVALGATIGLLVKRRIAFWAPLAAGVLAAAVFWIAFGVAIASDPDFITRFS